MKVAMEVAARPEAAASPKSAISISSLFYSIFALFYSSFAPFSSPISAIPTAATMPGRS